MKILMTVENDKAKEIAAKMIPPAKGFDVTFWMLPHTTLAIQDATRHALNAAQAARKLDADIVIHTAHTLDGEILSNALQVFRIPMFGTTNAKWPHSLGSEQTFYQPVLEKIGIPLAPYSIAQSIDEVAKLSQDYFAEGKVVRYHVGRGSLMRKIPYLKTTEDLEILCECLRRSKQSSGQIPKTMLEPSDEKSPYGYYLTLFGPNAIDGFGFIQVASSNGGTFRPLEPEEDAIFRRTVANKLATQAQRNVDNASGWFFIKFLWDNNAPQVLHVDHRVPTEDSVIKATRDGNWLSRVLELLDQSWSEPVSSVG